MTQNTIETARELYIRAVPSRAQISEQRLHRLDLNGIVAELDRVRQSKKIGYLQPVTKIAGWHPEFMAVTRARQAISIMADLLS